MQVCFVCNRAVGDKAKHECPAAKKLAEKPINLVTYIHSAAVPTRWK